MNAESLAEEYEKTQALIAQIENGNSTHTILKAYQAQVRYLQILMIYEVQEYGPMPHQNNNLQVIPYNERILALEAKIKKRADALLSEPIDFRFIADKLTTIKLTDKMKAKGFAHHLKIAFSRETKPKDFETAFNRILNLNHENIKGLLLCKTKFVSNQQWESDRGL